MHRTRGAEHPAPPARPGNSIVPTSYMLGPEVHASVTCVGFTDDPHSLICRKATLLASPCTLACNTSLTSGVGSKVSSSFPTPDLVTNIVTKLVVLLCMFPCRMYNSVLGVLCASSYFPLLPCGITFIFLEVFWKQPTCRRIKYSHQTKRNIMRPACTRRMHTKPPDNSGSPAGVCAEPHAPGSTPCRAPIPPRLRRPPKA